MAIQAILTDIEGTTSSIGFVLEELFPYARARMQDYLLQNADELQAEIGLVREQAGEPGAEPLRIAEILLQWMDEDRKVTALKEIQGRIWREGYLDGSLQGHVYPDAVVALQRWYAEGRRLYVYSSGSVDAQKLIFGYSLAGDLTPMFDGYFDTRIGGKRESASYQRIAGQLGIPAGEILFLSDVVEELDAARQSGMQTCGLVREGGQLQGHQCVASFADIQV